MGFNNSTTKPEYKRLLVIAGVLCILVAVAVAIAVPLTINSRATSLDAAKKILDEVPIIDGHNDWSYQIRNNLKNVINNVSLHDDFTELYTPSHTDIPRLREGKVGAQFWASYAPCESQYMDALRRGLEQIDLIRRFTNDYPDTFVFATTADEIEEANRNGKIASLIGVEGGHMIDSSLAIIRMFFTLGARYMTLTHSCDTPWASGANLSTTTGLTSFGELVVKEMNRLGILVDISHVNDKTMLDSMEISKAPVIFSHSNPRNCCEHRRNVPDDVLQQLKNNNGVIMINFYNEYVTCSLNATLSDVADHFDYVKKLIGTDYIGMGADYDGVEEVPEGLQDVSTYPYLIAELFDRGWTEDELKDIAGRNILRVMRAAEAVALELQEETEAGEEWISVSEIPDLECRT